MDTPSKEEIRKAKKSESNKKFRDRQKQQKESSEDTESQKSEGKESKSSFFFQKLAELVKQNLIQVTVFTIIPLVGKTIISRVMSNTLRISNNGQTQPESTPKEPETLPQIGYLPANF